MSVKPNDKLNPYDRVIWSADVTDVATLTNWLDEMPLLRHIKIDRLFVDRNGWNVFNMLHDRGLLVFFDAKSVEITSKLASLASVHVERAFKPFMLNCMAGGLSTLDNVPGTDTTDGLKRFADVCLAAGTQPCAVTVLTTKSPKAIGVEFNGRSGVDQVLTYVDILSKAGFTNVVCSPLEAAAIRDDPTFDHLEINTPGVRPVWSSSNDQARTDTPAGAIRLGVDRLVIGRPITNGPGTPAENLAAIANEIRSCI